MSAELSELRFIHFSIGQLEWKSDFRIPHVKRVEKRLAVDERSVVDIE